MHCKLLEEMNEKANLLWDECLRIIKDNLSDAHYESWFAPITVQNYDSGVLTLRIPSAFYAEQIDGRFGNLLKSVLKKVYGTDLKHIQYSYNIVKGDNNA